MRYPWVLGLLVLGASVPMFGSIILSAGVDVLPTPPATVQVSTGADDSTAFAFEESSEVTSAPINVAVGSEPGTYVCCGAYPHAVVPADLSINSYLLYSEPLTDQPGKDYRVYTGSVTFSPGESIVGVIVGFSHLGSTNATLGAPGTLYGTGPYYGLEGHDTISITGNLETLSFTFYTVPYDPVNGEHGIDSIRILTTSSVPEPADFLLIGSGLLAVGLLFRARTRLRRG